MVSTLITLASSSLTILWMRSRVLATKIGNFLDEFSHHKAIIEALSTLSLIFEMIDLVSRDAMSRYGLTTFLWGCRVFPLSMPVIEPVETLCP